MSSTSISLSYEIFSILSLSSRTCSTLKFLRISLIMFFDCAIFSSCLATAELRRSIVEYVCSAWFVMNWSRRVSGSSALAISFSVCARRAAALLSICTRMIWYVTRIATQATIVPAIAYKMRILLGLIGRYSKSGCGSKSLWRT